METINKEHKNHIDMKNKSLTIYRIITGIFTLQILMGAMMYFFKYDMVSEMFQQLGFPTYLIYPLAFAKLLGLSALWFFKSDKLKEWAYAAFSFNITLAVCAHIGVNDGEFAPALVTLLILIGSYIFHGKLQKQNKAISI